MLDWHNDWDASTFIKALKELYQVDKLGIDDVKYDWQVIPGMLVLMVQRIRNTPLQEALQLI